MNSTTVRRGTRKYVYSNPNLHHRKRKTKVVRRPKETFFTFIDQLSGVDRLKFYIICFTVIGSLALIIAGGVSIIESQKFNEVKINKCSLEIRKLEEENIKNTIKLNKYNSFSNSNANASNFNMIESGKTEIIKSQL